MNWYVYCSNNPLKNIDPDGMKDKEYDEGTDTPYDDIATRSMQAGATPIEWYGPDIYNCHSYAWHDSQGDPDGNGAPDGYPKWENDPSDDIYEQGYEQLDPDDPNEPGDRVIYYVDENANESWDDNEYISHSAVVKTVDNEGYTTEVIAKCGYNGISTNHPRAPKYYKYETYNVIGIEIRIKTSRAYFRKEE